MRLDYETQQGLIKGQKKKKKKIYELFYKALSLTVIVFSYCNSSWHSRPVKLWIPLHADVLLHSDTLQGGAFLNSFFLCFYPFQNQKHNSVWHNSTSVSPDTLLTTLNRVTLCIEDCHFCVYLFTMSVDSL